jgi:hypothetical protein
MSKFSETGEISLSIGSDFGNCFIYFLLQGEEVVYVGQTKKGLARPFTHKDKLYDNVKIIKCEEKDLTLLESSYIAKYAPKYNKTIESATLQSLYNARNKLRNLTAYSNLTIPQLRKVLSRLEIVPIKIDGIEYLHIDDFRLVITEMEEKVCQ